MLKFDPRQQAQGTSRGGGGLARDGIYIRAGVLSSGSAAPISAAPDSRTGSSEQRAATPIERPAAGYRHHRIRPGADHDSDLTRRHGSQPVKRSGRPWDYRNLSYHGYGFGD